MKQCMDYWKVTHPDAVTCYLCPHECVIKEGKRGLCRVRENQGNVLYNMIYGKYTAVSIDPVEKKPLYHFYPGSDLVSVGFTGCSLHCGYCINNKIVHDTAITDCKEIDFLTIYDYMSESDAIGVAFTFSEPLMNIEWLIDFSKNFRECFGTSKKLVLVTNGVIDFQFEPVRRLLTLIDAVNLDYKGSAYFYKTVCGCVVDPEKLLLEWISFCAMYNVHLEISCMIIPGLTDKSEELLHDLKQVFVYNKAVELGKSIPIHIASYIRSYHLRHIDPTPESIIKAMYKAVKQHTPFVYLENTKYPECASTVCPACNQVLIERNNYDVTVHSEFPTPLFKE